MHLGTPVEPLLNLKANCFTCLPSSNSTYHHEVMSHNFKILHMRQVTDKTPRLSDQPSRKFHLASVQNRIQDGSMQIGQVWVTGGSSINLPVVMRVLTQTSRNAARRQSFRSFRICTTYGCTNMLLRVLRNVCLRNIPKINKMKAYEICEYDKLHTGSINPDKLPLAS